MKIALLSEHAIRLQPDGSGLTVEPADDAIQYSPFHMLASGMAVCSYSVLLSWAANADLAFDDLALEVRWSFTDDPHRVGRIELTIEWPSLPDDRADAAARAASLCAIHATLSHPPQLETRVQR